jgi:hypothetical protein
MRVFPFVLLSILLSPCLAAAHQSGAAEQPPSTLRDAPLPPTVQKDIIAAIVEDNKGSTDESYLRETALDSSVSFLALSRTGAKTIVVRVNGGFLCGNHGNCPYYLFLKEKQRAIPIFQAVGNGPTVEPGIHNGVHDISTFDVMSAGGEGSIEVEEFDGKVYRPEYCYEMKIDQNGRRKVSRHHPCG